MDENNKVVSEDYWMIITIMSKKHTPENVARLVDGRGKPYLEFTFGEDCKFIEADYLNGTEIMVNVHDVENATKIFKRYMQYHKISKT